jgi:hypothetical protein
VTTRFSPDSARFEPTPSGRIGACWAGSYPRCDTPEASRMTENGFYVIYARTAADVCMTHSAVVQPIAVRS